MAKTLTVRVDDDTYHIIKSAAEGERRTLSNFIEYATIHYVLGEYYVEDVEMDEIRKDKALVKNLSSAAEKIKKGKYKFVR